jgi:hypothetical protein
MSITNYQTRHIIAQKVSVSIKNKPYNMSYQIHNNTMSTNELHVSTKLVILRHMTQYNISHKLLELLNERIRR